MKSLISILTVPLLLFSFMQARAEWTNHGKGLGFIQSAWTQPKGTMRLGTHANSFFKDEVVKNSDGTTTGITYWDVQSGLGLRYGLTNRFEVGISQIVYQDNHKDGRGYNTPDDLYLSAKFGSIGKHNSNIRLGLLLNSRIPLAEYHNVPFESYSAGRIEVGVMGLLTFASDPLFPDHGVNVHINVGILNHNDMGMRLTSIEADTITATKSSQELLYGIGFLKKGREFGLFLEVFGRDFIQQPPITAYTRENAIFAMPGVVYDPNPWLTLMVGLNLRISGDKDETDYIFTRKISKNLPNLPSWRIHFGASISLLANRAPKSAEYRPTEFSSSVTSQEDGAELYKTLADERRKTEDAEEELERIRTERQRMEQMLERLRRILEWPTESAQSKEAQNQTNPTTP